MISQRPSPYQTAPVPNGARQLWTNCVVGLAATLVTAAIAFPTIFVMPTDEELFERSHLIVVATAESEHRTSFRDAPSTHFTLRIERVLKGTFEERTLRVRTLSGLSEDGLIRIVEGVPRFTSGDRSILFLVATDGTFRVTDMELGHFVERTKDSQHLAHRSITATELVRPNDPLEEARRRSRQLRQFDRFASWIGDRGAGTQRPPDYFLQQESGLQSSGQAFTNITFNCGAGPAIARWAEFDTGVHVDVEMWDAGQPGVPGGGSQQLQNGMNAWNDVPATSLFLHFAGTTPSNAGGDFPGIDGVNRVVPEDPNDIIAGTFNGSGIVAASIVVADCGAVAEFVHGLYAPVVDVDIIGQDGVAANFLPGTIDSSLAWERILTHELGHLIGLGHSCQDNCSGVAASAIMRGDYIDSLLGSRLGIDDENAARFTYPGSLREVPATGRAGLTVLTALLVLLALSFLRSFSRL